MWSAEDVARDSVRRQAKGLDAAAVAERVAEAVARAREIRTGRPSEYQLATADPEWLAEVWAAKHAEWQRVRDLIFSSGWDTYEPEQDVQGSRWAQERLERRQVAVKARSAFEAWRREAGDELRVELWLAAGRSRLIRTAAAQAGLHPQEVLAQLAERVVVDEDGTVWVSPFTPYR